MRWEGKQGTVSAVYGMTKRYLAVVYKETIGNLTLTHRAWLSEDEVEVIDAT